MKVFEINSVPYGSTGRIMFQIADRIKEQSGEVITSCSYTKPRNIHFPTYHYQIGGIIGKLIHIKLADCTGKHGCYSKMATKGLIKKIRDFDPDIIHIHNLHGWFLNIPLLFDFFAEYGKPIVWTLHDCWAFTGHCTFYTMRNCFKWIEGCRGCEAYKEYPKCNFDDSDFQFRMKSEWFTKLQNVAIVTPSKWLASNVKKSYLRKYPVVVIHNGIDLSIFKAVKSDFRKKYALINKIILLGVAFDWGERKGVSCFEKLARELDDRFQIVLVGISTQQRKNLPDNIICIENVQDQNELAAIYTAADYFINPTLEDNFPTVNLEALSCGTPVITYDTGGCGEMLKENCGFIVQRGNYEELLNIIKRLPEKSYAVAQACINCSRLYNQDNMCMEYISLFKNISFN